MTKKTLWLSLPLCMVIALLAAFLFVSPAFAQDEVPPKVVPTEESAGVQPTEAAPAEVVPTEVPAEVLPTEVAPTEVMADEPTDAVSVEETPASELSLAEALDEAGVVLSDSTGDPLSLAAQSSEQLINNGDPYFWVGTTKYSYMVDCGSTPNCTSDPNPIQKAIDDIDLGVRIPSDKTLYFDAATYNVPQVMINSVSGLNRLMGVIDPATGEPVVVINVDTFIGIHQDNGFTITGFRINGNTSTIGNDYGALDFWGTTGTVTLTDLCVNNAAPDGTGIMIGGQHGAVVIQNVDSSNNGGGGVRIFNVYSSGAGVTIKNSNFSDNDGNGGWANGISIHTGGVVTLDGVSTNRNEGTLGALQIFESGNVTIKNSVFIGNGSWGIDTGENINGTVLLDNVFANDNYSGIRLAGRGNITANNVHTNENDLQGAVFDTCWDSDFDPYNDSQSCTNPGSGNISITNSEFNNNTSNYAGLSVFAKGAITLTNVDASDNYDYTDTSAGARLQNYGSASVYPVTVNSSTFDWNDDDGLEIKSKGLVTINKVKANFNAQATSEDNHSYGIFIDNTYGTSGVTLNGTGWSDNVVYYNATGLLIETKGSILINYLDADYNTYNNTKLNNTEGSGNVTVNKSSFTRSLDGLGISIESKGVVVLNDFIANDNWGIGAYIDNTTAVSPKSVVIKGGKLTNNSSGLIVLSHGSITINDTIARNSYGSCITCNGAYLQNDYANPLGNQFGQPISIFDSSFDNNQNYGLLVHSFGVLTIKNSRANWNLEGGAVLDNFAATLPKTITIIDSTFKGNQKYNGLVISSRGNVNITNVDASGNSISDGWINYGDTAKDVVSPENDDFWRFSGHAGEIVNLGINLINPNKNDSFEIWLFDEMRNLMYDGPFSVDSDNFGNPNYDFAVTGFSLPADGNYIFQVFSGYSEKPGTYQMYFWEGSGDWSGPGNDITRIVNGASIQTEGTVTITNPVDYWRFGFLSNNGFGLNIDTKGSIKLTNINASYNAGQGSTLTNKVGSLTSGITLTGSNFDGNGADGLSILTNGVVLLTKTIANENFGKGANINNIPLSGVSAPAVTVINDAYKVRWWRFGFSGNGDAGLNINTRGAISLSNLSADGNGAVGAYLNNNNGLADIKLTNTWFNNNTDIGVNIDTRGNINFSKGAANGNDAGRGASLVTSPLSGIKNVTITDVSFIYNNGYGLYVRNNGNITLKNIQATYNYGYDGVNLDNMAGFGIISITNGYFNNNENGLIISTFGNVTLTTVHAEYNSRNGTLVTGDVFPARVVAISGSTFSNNDESGLGVWATGNITLTNVDARGNGYLGANLVNTFGTGNISVLGTLPNINNDFSGNLSHGLMLNTSGSISITKVDASENGIRDEYGVPLNLATGLYLTDTNSAGTSPITISSSYSNGNTWCGLLLSTIGTVTVNGLSTSGNRGGIYIDQTGALDGSKPVILNKIVANDNFEDGINLNVKGSITINGVNALQNGNAGAMLINNFGSSTSITVLNSLGNNVMNDNWVYGLYAQSNGAISITGLAASDNRGLYAVLINNYQDGAGNGNVTVSKSTINNNLFHGLVIATNRAAIISNSTFLFNGLDDPATGGTVEYGNGLSIYNYNAAFNATITGSIMIGNGAYGIRVYKNGGVNPVITNTFYFGNDMNLAGISNLLITD